MLLSNLSLLTTAPGGVGRLRELILTLAVQGKLVPQDPRDEPASELLKKIRAEKDRLIAEGKIKRDKLLAEIAEEQQPFPLPRAWKWVRALDICALITDGDHQPPPKADTGVPFLVIGDVRTGEVLLRGASRFVPESYFEEIDWGKKPCLGDVLYTTVGSFGIPVPVVQQQRFCFQRHIALFRPAAVELQSFLALALRTKLAFRQAEKGATGIAQKTVPLSALRDLVLPLPPLAEQSRIVTRVEELMRLCDALEAKGRLEAAQHAQLVSTLLGTLTQSETPKQLADNWQRTATHFDLLLDRPEAVDALEQTILQLAVRGLLVPQDPQDEPASELLHKIRTEKDRLIAKGKIKRDKPLPPIAEEEQPFELPQGWTWVRLNSLLQKIGAGSTPLGGREVYVPSGVKFLRSQNVWDDGLRLTGVAFIKPATHTKMAGTVVVANDLLFNITGASIGRCAVVPSDFDEANVSQHVTIVRTVLPALNEFLHKVLVSRHVQQAVMDVQVGVSREGLSIAKLGQFVIPLPPLDEQSRIVTRVASLRRLCADLRQRLAASQSTQALLAEALAREVI